MAALAVFRLAGDILTCRASHLDSRSTLRTSFSIQPRVTPKGSGHAAQGASSATGRSVPSWAWSLHPRSMKLAAQSNERSIGTLRGAASDTQPWIRTRPSRAHQARTTAAGQGATSQAPSVPHLVRLAVTRAGSLQPGVVKTAMQRDQKFLWPRDRPLTPAADVRCPAIPVIPTPKRRHTPAAEALDGLRHASSPTEEAAATGRAGAGLAGKNGARGHWCPGRRVPNAAGRRPAVRG